MSYTGTQVYLPAEYTAGSVASWLGQKLPDAHITTVPHGLRVSLQGADLRVTLDTAKSVRTEAIELADRAPAGCRAALRRATQRLEVTPNDPRANADAVYNALLVVFETLRGIPNGVGLDPFDGAFYFDAAAATGDR